MEKKFIGSGLLAGLIAGIVSFIYARIYLEPQVAKAIDYEDYSSGRAEFLDHAHSHDAGGHDHGGETEVFTRSVQENIGAGVGTVIFALCMGAFFAVAFTILWAYVARRWENADPRLAALALGIVGFVAVIGVPFFVYPPNPPAVGEEDTIGARSGAYLTLTVVSVVLAVLAVLLAFYLWDRFGGLVSGLLSSVAFLIGVTITAALLPTFAEVPGPQFADGAEWDPGSTIEVAGFPGQVVADFRVYAIANQVILWTVLLTVFCLLLTVLMRRQAAAEPSGDRVAA